MVLTTTTKNSWVKMFHDDNFVNEKNVSGITIA